MFLPTRYFCCVVLLPLATGVLRILSGSADKLLEFKRWFWAVVDRMGPIERQELLYFWTGSPALPASEDGFQPMPTITIRPQDDQHLPTANTCISRLYVPLYSSR